MLRLVACVVRCCCHAHNLLVQRFIPASEDECKQLAESVEVVSWQVAAAGV
jgi:hypothetical protein